MQLRNSKFLVTGGAGFIGSNLVDALLASGSRVTVIDNFSTGKRENLAHLAVNRAFTLVEGDIRSLDDCRRAVAGVDGIFHQAALGSVPRSIRDPMSTTAVNVLGFVNILQTAVEMRVGRVVYASSSSVYGDSPQLPKREDRIGKPLSPYAVSKYADELLADNFHQLHGLDCIGLRYFNVFGPRQDPDGAYAAVIPRFALALLRHEEPVINGDGSYSRDFTYVDNAVQANLKAMECTAPEALNQAYNIACGECTTLDALFGMLRSALSASDPAIAAIEARHGPERPGDIPHSLADIGKAMRLLGYAPQVGVREGLQRTAGWYRNRQPQPATPN